METEASFRHSFAAPSSEVGTAKATGLVANFRRNGEELEEQLGAPDEMGLSPKSCFLFNQK